MGRGFLVLVFGVCGQARWSCAVTWDGWLIGVGLAWGVLVVCFVLRFSISARSQLPRRVNKGTWHEKWVLV